MNIDPLVASGSESLNVTIEPESESKNFSIYSDTHSDDNDLDSDQSSGCFCKTFS